ncbi:autotransporter beta-domain-containing protein [Campylobacter jejuni subsp. doylei]|uniref:Autotransporter beta-domain-containing protein n=1 Tax=Campylobacter jejuni subsp. doylei TaxID=32021 RepID=A0A448J9D7_CAMJU|nr:autotransporter beta-domain-containing protein [Campylobacter jejuni subsp. doylei]
MKNTSLVKTLGGGVKEYSFNSKKIVLSLATISFLASYANASTTTGTSGTTDACPTTSSQARSGSSSTNGSTYNCTINSLYNSGNQGITLSDRTISNVTLTITQGGTLGPSNYSASHTIYAFKFEGKNGNTPPTLTLINEGTIQGKIGVEKWDSSSSNNKTITVKNFDNKQNGFIDGHIYMGGYATISIENFTNEGTITTSNNNDGVIYFENSQNGNIHIKTFHNKNTGTIESKNGKNSITVKAQGSQTPILENFINQGTIKGKIGIENNNGSFTGTITVGTFENKNTGTIDGHIYMGIWKGSGTISIENFNNEGTISGKSRNEKGVHFEAQGSAKVHIKTFHNKNTGTIESKDRQGVYFQGNVHVETFHNEGFITGSGNSCGDGCFDNYLRTEGGVSMSRGTIDTFKNSGTIISTGTKKEHNPAGVKLNYATVKTFENTGFISGTLGVMTTQGTIETFKNSGTIESKSGAAIKIQTAYNKTNPSETPATNASAITHFTNEGTIKSASDGVLIESGNKIETLTNKGTIESKSNGISLFDHGINSKLDNAHLGKIILEKDSSIKAGKKGINIDNQTTARSIRVGGIEVKAGASVSGDEAGIYLGKSKEITAPITISGTVSGGNAGIVNKGSITAPITISGTVSGGNAGIVNESEGRMAKGIINDGEAELVISNQGLVEEDDKGNTVANNGSGSVRIKEWVVTTNEETGRLRTVHVGGSNTENVKVNSITVDQSNLNLEELNDITNIISGVSTNNIADSVKTNGGGEISLSFDPLSGRLSTDVQLNASIAGASFRSSLATASRRATFIDNVMANAMQSFSLGSDKAQKIALSEKGNLYADASDYIKNDSIMNDYIKNDLTQGSYNSNKEHALFILPYFSSQSVELSLNEESKGHTKGTIIGYSTLKDSGIYGVYAGYEDKKMDSTYFGINDISYYTGLKYFNTLFTTAKGQEVYIKAQVQGALIKNDFTKKIGKNEAKAKAHSYTYGINTAWGMNFIADKNIFSPEAGFAYEGSYTEAFSMQDTRGKATVQGGERTYANHLNLFSTKTSFTWFRDWLPNLKTSVELGAKFNVNPKVKARARFGDKKVSNEFHLPRVRKFASTSLIVPVNEAFYFSLNYNGMFDEKGNTHTGFAQFNYLW